MKQHVKFGFGMAFSIVIANMIGIGIFTSLGFQVIGISDYKSILLLWLLGGTMALIGSFCYSELCAAFPKSGGEYHFLSLSFGKLTGFLSGWVSVTLGFAAPIAAAAYAFSTYFMDLLPVDTPIPRKAVSVLIIALITLVHCLHKNIGARFQQVFTFSKIILLVVFIVLGLFKYFQSNAIVGPVQDNLLHGSVRNDIAQPFFWVSLIFVSYAYSGWNASAYIIEEIKNPIKNVPRSLIAGTVAVMILYTLIIWVFMLVTPAAAIAGKEDMAFIAAGYIVSKKGALIIGALISFFLVSTISSMIVVAPRIVKRMGDDYQEFAYFATTNKHGIPIRAILLQSLIAMVVVVTSSFQFIIVALGFILIFFNTLTVLSVVILRKKYPDLVRPIKVPLYPLLPFVFCLFNFWIMYYSLMNATLQVLSGMAILLLGVVVFFYSQKKLVLSKKLASVLLITTLLGLASCNNNGKNSATALNDSAQVKGETAADSSFTVNDTIDKKAAIIAGLDTTSLNEASKKDADKIQYEWRVNKKTTLDPIGNWVAKNGFLKSITRPHTMFYPFSGPDFSFAYAFYPDAENYVFAGLEPVGNLKGLLSADTVFASRFLNRAQQVLYFSNHFGFFRTLDMKDQFKEDGALNVILFYLKNYGASIGTVQLLKWNGANKTVEQVQSDSVKADACAISFKMPSKKPQQLYYFSKDLSSDGLQNDAGFLPWIKNLSPGAPIVSLTKSASYLMHTAYFADIRNFILQQSTLHIQDDSGIGFDFIEDSKRKCRLFGKYSKVIPVFKKYYQNKLNEKYQTDATADLPFSIGYNKVFAQTNIQVIQ